MLGSRLVLLNNADTSILGSDGGAAGTSPWVSPELPRNMLDAFVIVTVESVSGAPTTATITPKFQAWHSVIGGNVEEVVGGGAGVVPDISWFDIATATNPSLLPDGDWPSAFDVHTATATTPVSTMRSVVGRGYPWRLKVAWAFTGGTTPQMKISAIAYVRHGDESGYDPVESA